jgi:GNAT superfamily N-acetyltransferase
MLSTMEMHIRPAEAHEAALVADVLGTAVAAMEKRGITLWDPAEISAAGVEAHVRAGMYHVASDEDGPLGVFRFQLEDKGFWPEVPEGTSAYVHKLAVYPQQRKSGVAQALLAHACELTRQQGRQFLRLDCMAGRPKLRAVYETFGFRHHSQVTMEGWLFDRFEFDVMQPRTSGP